MNYNYGIKMWSINTDWTDVLLDHYNEGYFQYIELFAVPHTYKDTAKAWEKIKSADIPVIIHGAHSTFKVNWADKEAADFNKSTAEDGFHFADMFNSEIIIFHPGYNGTPEETIKQLGSYKDSRIVIENKPHITKSDPSLIFRGSTPEELKILLDGTGYDCCVDFAHAICSANSHKVNGYDYVNDFLKLPYRVCHLSDNPYKNEDDNHLSIGKGEYDFKKLISKTKKNTPLTLETPKKDFNDFIQDIEYLRHHV